MVRRGSSLAVAAVAGLALTVSGCADGGDGSGSGATTTAGTAPVTVPEDADPGLGYLVLDGVPHLLQVRSCQLDPTSDPATGVSTDLAIDADDGVSLAIAITRSTIAGDLPTTTDNITVAEGDAVSAESQRVDRSGTYLDLRAPGALEPLLTVEGTLVRAEGVFGPLGSRDGDPGLVEGSLTLRCPPAG